MSMRVSYSTGYASTLNECRGTVGSLERTAGLDGECTGMGLERGGGNQWNGGLRILRAPVPGTRFHAEGVGADDSIDAVITLARVHCELADVAYIKCFSANRIKRICSVVLSDFTL